VKRVLIIDGMNNFTRSYVVDPTLDTNGNPIGGLSGFLKILQKNIREVRPDKVIVCWEGPSGSLKRRSINKNYKAGRKAPRLNRQFDLTPKEEKENKIQQHVRLLDYLELLPVTQLVIDNVEADDLIAWAARAKYFNGWQKVILSNDKDFYQLCDDDTIIVRPVTKEIMNKSRILSDFNIHPDNFGLARAIVGDSSDNIAGVAGVGLPTVAKRLPFLKEDKSFDVSDVIKYCKENVGGVKAYSSIAENDGPLRPRPRRRLRCVRPLPDLDLPRRRRRRRRAARRAAGHVQHPGDRHLPRLAVAAVRRDGGGARRAHARARPALADALPARTV